VAAFIADTKGKKYSALLPLLGLHRLEIAAENLRQLSKAVIEESKLTERENDLQVCSGGETQRSVSLATKR
jgi:hypothetical protein